MNVRSLEPRPQATRAQLDGILTVLEQQKKPEPSIVKALLTSAKAVVEGVGAVQLVDENRRVHCWNPGALKSS